MKLKSKYILRTIADKTIAIALESGDKKTDEVITLNQTGAFIFSLINEGSDFDTIVEKFFAEYEVSTEEATEAVENFVEYLKNSDLLEDDGQKKMKF